MPRTRLVRRLVGARQVPLVVLVAPAGYGKTTVLHQWAAQDDRVFAWLADDRSASPAASIALALERAGAVERGRAGTLERAAPAVAIQRLSTLVRTSRRPFVLVIDDAGTPPLLDAVAAIVPELPAGSQVALAARAEPRLPLGRLRTHRSVVEVRPRDLVMTRFEAAALLDRAGLRPELDDVETLVRRTEGWPAGLYLAALSLNDQADRPDAIEAFAGDDYVVSDYIRDELLSGLSADALSFLTRSSLLERLSGPLCDAVLERSDSARVLKEFAGSNLLVSRLDRTGDWYRYHRLFADALRSELRRLEPGLEPELNRRASLWYEATGNIDGALHHAVAARDLARASSLLWKHTATYLAHGRSAAIARLLGDFGDQVASSPALALTAAHTDLVRGRLDHARRWEAAASRALRRGGRRDRSLEASAALIRAAVADDGAQRMRADAAHAETLLPPESPWSALCSLLLGAAEYLTGDRESAREQFEEGVRRGVVDAPDIQAVCLAQLALLAIEEDDWERAAAHTLRARAQLERYSIADSPMSALVLAVSALVGAHRGRPDEATTDLHRATAAVEPLTEFMPWYLAETYASLSRAALRLSDVVEARRLAERACVFASEVSETSALRDSVADAARRIDEFSTSAPAVPSSLTKAELRILQFLPTHLSFREIAARLYVSANTVKTQAHAVYRKLDVSSRSEAVLRARTLGLLDA